MHYSDRFKFPPRVYAYSEKPDFSSCGEKVEIDPNAPVEVDFMREEEKHITAQPTKAAESMPTLAQSTQQHSAKPALSPRETSEIARCAAPAVTMPESTANGEIRRESKHSISNFANARLF